MILSYHLLSRSLQKAARNVFALLALLRGLTLGNPRGRHPRAPWEYTKETLSQTGYGRCDALTTKKRSNGHVDGCGFTTEMDGPADHKCKTTKREMARGSCGRGVPGGRQRCTRQWCMQHKWQEMLRTDYPSSTGPDAGGDKAHTEQHMYHYAHNNHILQWAFACTGKLRGVGGQNISGMGSTGGPPHCALGAGKSKCLIF